MLWGQGMCGGGGGGVVEFTHQLVNSHKQGGVGVGAENQSKTDYNRLWFLTSLIQEMKPPK